MVNPTKGGVAKGGCYTYVPPELDVKAMAATMPITLDAETVEVVAKPRRGGMWFEVTLTQKSGVIVCFRAKHYSMTTGGVEVFRK